jgi:hypothetical protein
LVLQDAITLRTQLDVKVAGNTVDELVGDAKLLNTFLITPKKERNLVIDTLLFSSRQRLDKRILNLESEFLTARMEGDFIPTQAWTDINQVLSEYQLYFFENLSDRMPITPKRRKRQFCGNMKLTMKLKPKILGSFWLF